MSEKVIMRVIYRSILMLTIVAALAWFMWAVRGVLVLILVSTILAVGLSPIVDAISGDHSKRKFLRLPRVAAALLLYAALLLTATLAAVGIIPQVVDQAEELALKVPAYAEEIRNSLRELEGLYPVLSEFESWLTTQVGEAFGQIGDVSAQVSKVLVLAMGVVNGVFAALLLLVFTFYLIIDGEDLGRRIVNLLPSESQRTAIMIAGRVRVKIASWLIGQLFLGASIGLATYVGLRLLGIPYALFLAVVAAIGELIPMIGPILAAVPAVIVAFQISPALGLLTIGLYIIIQQLENNIIVPQVMRRAVDLPPVVVMAALLMGYDVLGIIGAMVALPVAAAGSVVLGELLALRSGQKESLSEIGNETAEPTETANLPS